MNNGWEKQQAKEKNLNGKLVHKMSREDIEMLWHISESLKGHMCN